MSTNDILVFLMARFDSAATQSYPRIGGGADSQRFCVQPLAGARGGNLDCFSDRACDSDPLDQRLRQKYRIRLIAPLKFNRHRKNSPAARLEKTTVSIQSTWAEVKQRRCGRYGDRFLWLQQYGKTCGPSCTVVRARDRDGS